MRDSSFCVSRVNDIHRVRRRVDDEDSSAADHNRRSVRTTKRGVPDFQRRLGPIDIRFRSSIPYGILRFGWIRKDSKTNQNAN